MTGVGTVPETQAPVLGSTTAPGSGKEMSPEDINAATDAAKKGKDSFKEFMSTAAGKRVGGLLDTMVDVQTLHLSLDAFKKHPEKGINPKQVLDMLHAVSNLDDRYFDGGFKKELTKLFTSGKTTAENSVTSSVTIGGESAAASAATTAVTEAGVTATATVAVDAVVADTVVDTTLEFATAGAATPFLPLVNAGIGVATSVVLGGSLSVSGKDKKKQENPPLEVPQNDLLAPTDPGVLGNLSAPSLDDAPTKSPSLSVKGIM